MKQKPPHQLSQPQWQMPDAVPEPAMTNYEQKFLNTLNNPDQFKKLHQIDWAQAPKQDTEAALELMDKYATPEQAADPSFWDRALEIAPAIVAGTMAMGPAGALLGAFGGFSASKDKKLQAENQRQQDGQRYAQNRFNMQNQGHQQNRLDWLQGEQGMQQQGIDNLNFERQQQLNAIEDHRVVQTNQTHNNQLLKDAQQSALNQQQMAARNYMLRSLGQGGGRGEPTVTTDPKMSEHMVLNMINSQPELVGPLMNEVLQQYGLDQSSFMSLPDPIVKAQIYAQLNQAMLTQAQSNPTLAASMQMFGDQYVRSGNSTAVSKMAGF